MNISGNRLLNKQSGRALAAALKVNSTLKELDVSSNLVPGSTRKDGAGFAQEFAIGLSANRVLTSLDLSINGLGDKGAKHVAEAIKMNVSSFEPGLSATVC